MKIIPQSHEIMTPVSNDLLTFLELCGRVCYKSEDKITPLSAVRFVRNLIAKGHESVLEHASITVRFITDRGISHQLVRHRHFSFSQESTRYVRYNQRNMEFISQDPERVDADTCELYSLIEDLYCDDLEDGTPPELARAVLPMSLKTEIIMTGNIRSWRLFLRQRTSKAAHPLMRQLAIGLLRDLQARVDVLFDDIEVTDAD